MWVLKGTLLLCGVEPSAFGHIANVAVTTA